MTRHTQAWIDLDGQIVPFEPGQTIMDAALAAHIYIPHLCHKPGLQPHGSCKLCTVEVDGRYVSACTTAAREDMVVASHTPALQAMRKQLTQMLFVEGNHLCPSCEKTGDCTLQAVAYYLGMLDGHYSPLYPHRDVDASHPDMILDRDRCIMCALCVRASSDVDGKHVFALSGRGCDTTLVVRSDSGRLGDSDFSTEDLAAHVCPVGALLMKDAAYEVPIGWRTFDLHSVAEPGMDVVVLRKDTHHA